MCTVLQGCDQQETWDSDLSNHLLSFILVALSSPEASTSAALRKRFVQQMLDAGEPCCPLLIRACGSLLHGC